MASDDLDASVCDEIGLKTQSVRNLRSRLTADGLIRARSEYDASGFGVTRWLVSRTDAPRAGAREHAREVSISTKIDTSVAHTPARAGARRLTEEQITELGVISLDELRRWAEAGEL
jgi:hypothetical protein